MSYDVRSQIIALRAIALRPCALSLAAALAVGCGDVPDDEEDLSLVQSAPCEPSVDGGVTEPEPEGEVDAGTPPVPTLFADVKANGSGCPAGSWDAKLAEDGESFYLSFTGFVAKLEAGSRTSFKDCNLSVSLRSTTGLSYALTDLHYRGQVKLDTGIRAFATSNHYFQGNPTPSANKELRTNLDGPLEKDFEIADTRDPADAVWSPCGLQRNLNIVTRVGIQAGEAAAAGATGSIALTTIGDSPTGEVGFKLAWRNCADGSPATAPTPTEEPTAKPTTTAPTTTSAKPASVDAGTTAADAGRPRSRWPWGSR